MSLYNVIITYDELGELDIINPQSTTGVITQFLIRSKVLVYHSEEHFLIFQNF